MKKTFKKLSSLLLAVLMCFSFAACGSDSSEENSSESSDSGNETTEYATTFTFAVGGEPQYLDPAVGSDTVTSFIINQLYYPLFIIGEDGSMIKEACESYEVSDDGMVYTLHLIENNYWSDGQQVTAHDYVYGMKRSIGMGAADSYYSYFITDFVLNAKAHGENMDDVADMDDVGIVALDDFTIEITLGAQCPYFVSLLASGVFYPVRQDYALEHDYTWAANPDVPTNGAFHPTSIDSSAEVVLAKNEYFTHADDVTIETMIAKVMPDMDAQLMAFQTGEIDFATSVNTEVTTIYAGQPELLISDSVINYFVLMNSYTADNEALEDVNVRRALQLGIDRTAIVTALDAGDVYYELYGLVPLGFEGVNGDFREEQDAEELLVYTDKEEAKALLAEAGYDESNPLKLTYYYNQSSMHDTVAEVMKAQLAEINVELTLKTGEIRTFFADRDDGLFELARHAMTADFMDVMSYLDMGASWTQSIVTWGDSTYDELLTATKTMSGDERIEALHAAEKYLVEEMAYCIPLFGFKNICLAKAGITGEMTNPQASYLFWYVKVPAN